MKPVYIGTSGWVYKDWEKAFYPEDIPAHEHLEFYATQFPTVEINATFYRLPTLAMVRGWRERTRPGFVFAVKGSRFLTHIKRLANLGGGLNKYMRRIAPLRPRLGPVLWQLPPTMKRDLKRLDAFLRRVPKTFSHAVEFRHRSWYENHEAFALLRKHQVAHVSLSSQNMPMNLTVTADFSYIRFHGLEHGAAHDYTKAELEPWAEHIRRQARAGVTVYAYFNNDLNVRAPANAKLLLAMVQNARNPAPKRRQRNSQKSNFAA